MSNGDGKVSAKEDFDGPRWCLEDEVKGASAK